jgi:hypothetical protein
MTTDMKPTLHPVGTPKFNLKKASLGVRKTPPTNKKRKSPKGTICVWLYSDIEQQIL